jgi:hypothetical protein
MLNRMIEKIQSACDSVDALNAPTVVGRRQSNRPRSCLGQRLCVTLAAMLASAAPPSAAPADEPISAEEVRKTVDAAGGEARLLRLFRMKEVLALGSDPEKKGSPRTTVVEPPLHWWSGTKDRVAAEKEPAVFLVWAWTLGALVDPKSKLEALPAAKYEDRELYGIRIHETISPPMDLYFDRETRRLKTIEWRADRHVFSEWRETDGVHYPARCVGYKLKDGRRWYGTEIVELERLNTLPEGLSR